MNKRISNLSQVAYLKKYVLTDGKEDGIRVIEIDNGKIRFTLNESKALDIMQFWHQGQNISFVSKNGFSKREIAFGKRFEGGMLYTVGLDNAGARDGYEVHGSFHNIPAKVISSICDENKIEVVAEIEDTALFNQNLKIIRKISTKIGSEEFYLEDTLINNGTRDENYCILYHTNFGHPFLDENVEILFDGKTVIPRNNLAKERISELHSFLPPVDNQDERCYYIENEISMVTLINKKSNKQIEFFYTNNTLPKMVMWQSNASQDYALGLEPCTTFLDNYFKYSVIKSGAKINFGIKIKIK